MEPDGEIIAIRQYELDPREEIIDLSSREAIKQRLTQLQRDFQDLSASAQDMQTRLGNYPEVIDDTHRFDKHLLDLYKAVGLTKQAMILLGQKLQMTPQDQIQIDVDP